MKYTICTLASVALLATTTVWAHFPTVTIDFIDGQSTAGPVIISPPTLPYTLNFEGTVTHEGGGNLNQIELSAEVNGTLVYEPTLLRGLGNATTTTYTIPYTLDTTGIYSVTITALHRDNTSDSNRCKAAPAIANTYLKATDTNRKDAEGTNAIAEVGKQTGKHGGLWAKAKCEPTYKTETIEFVMEVLEDGTTVPLE